MKYTKSDMNHRFNKRLNELIASKSQNTKIFSKLQYSEMIQKVKISKANKNKKPEDYHRLRRYDVYCDVMEREKLIAPPKQGSVAKFYVNTEEIFEILHETHVSIGHGGRNKMEKTIHSKYKNITREMIGIYLSLCKTCGKRHNASRKSAAENSILNTEMNSRGQVDIINMVSQQDGEYKFIMVYRDHVTKFVQMRPLKTDRIKEITQVLLDVFTMFGAPNILQSSRGREFANNIIREMASLWPDLKMVHGTPRHSHIHGARATLDIQNMLRSWLAENRTRNWTEGIRFVQLMMNGAHNSRINCSPYEAMFGTTIKLGLPSELAEELPDELMSEEELRAFSNN